jgi:N6-adenosine-specific RNA methylase IME4
LAWEWLKFNPVTGKAAFGPGYGTRKNVEPCLLARRGSPVLKNRSVRDWMVGEDAWDDLLVSPRREHSRKPDEAYDRIETMFDGPYLELNARQTRPGWSAWGDEVGKFDQRSAIEDMF